MSIEAIKLALEALEDATKHIFLGDKNGVEANIRAHKQCESLRQAIAELESQEQWGVSAVMKPEYVAEQQKKTEELRSMLESQKPVAWLKVNEDSWTISLDAEPDHIPLYTHPQLKAEKQEPVAEVTSKTGAEITMSWWHEPALPIGTKLYTTPQPKQEQDEPVAIGAWQVYGKNGDLLYTLPKAEQEPAAIVVASQYEDGSHAGNHLEWRGRNEANDFPEGTAFYTTPQQRTWVGLTDEEIQLAWKLVERSDFYDCVVPLSKTIEEKLKEKNT